MNVRWLIPAYRVDVRSNGASISWASSRWMWCMPWQSPTTSSPVSWWMAWTLAVIGLE